MFRPYKIKKTEPETMEKVLKLFIARNGLTTGVNCQIVFETWDKVSGAGPYTLNRFYRDGNLYITVSSSVVRNQLYFQRDALLKAMNDALVENPMFEARKGLVRNIIFK